MTDNLTGFIFLLLSTIITPDGQEAVTAISTHNTALACNQTMLNKMRTDNTLGCYRHRRDRAGSLVLDEPDLKDKSVSRITGYDNTFRPDQLLLKIERVN